MSAPTRRGFYRVQNIPPLSDEVWVEDAGSGMLIDKATYAQYGYLPRWDDLPWRDDYFAQKAEAEKAARAAAKAPKEPAKETSSA